MVPDSPLRRSAIVAGRMFREQALGTLLLRPEGRQRFLALPREQREQGEEDRPADDDVESQQHAGKPLGQRGRNIQRDSDEPRRKENSDEGYEPADAGAHTIEDQCAEWGEDAPDARRAAGEESAEGDHRQRRRQQDVPELDVQEQAVVAVPGEECDGHDGNRRIEQRHRARPGTESEIQAGPQERDRQDQDRDQDEQRFAVPRLVVIGWVGADLRKPVSYAVEQAPKARHGARLGPAAGHDGLRRARLLALAPRWMQPNTHETAPGANGSRRRISGRPFAGPPRSSAAPGY